MKRNEKISLEQFRHLSEAGIQVPLHPDQANLDNFLDCFSLSSLKPLIHLNPICLFKVFTLL
jgi:hypothetical protein